ncbi:MAG: 4Fe-4S dicluster domain-containing protein [Erysipelotrichaceae bacterium]|jgi:Na+-translocating ferredoxin:NAD+ oxidoreductase RNF subunit RnfB|nr:4Fe-4S dicluster domain-containing protein [Erysipelotrichaceae bacterium]
MSTVISYTLKQCTRCNKCLKQCPTSALTVKDERIVIESKRCINCGACLDACVHQGMQAKGSTLADLENYDYTVALIPTAVFGDCETPAEAATLTAAIGKLGFDEVVELSSYDGALMNALEEVLASDTGSGPLIWGFCPVVHAWIKETYPALLDRVIPFVPVSELAAADVRKRLKAKYENIGIFHLCECVSKLAMAKYPYGGKRQWQVDHALSLTDLFPQISRLQNKCEANLSLCRKGLTQAGMNLFLSEFPQYDCTGADGLVKVQRALETMEFGQLKKSRFVYLSNCLGGCVGGNLLWGNPFDKQVKIRDLCRMTHGQSAQIEASELFEEPVYEKSPPVSMAQRLKEVAEINAQLEQLPGYDCGACGYPTCRSLAEDILKNKSSLDKCRLRRRRSA